MANEAEDSMERAFATIFAVVVVGIVAAVIGGLVWLVKHLF